MGPQENVEIVRRVYDEYAERGELPMALVADDFTFDVSDAAPDMAGTHGRDEAEILFRSYAEMFDDFSIELKEVIAVDATRVVTAVRDGGRVKGSEAEIHNEFFHVWTVRDGRIERWTSHANQSAALKAAGLTE
ncbi:MAG TPA: nuclear transport factor 2 family protein [Solirubrobacterales bacterium]|nr:nuclear transport factor 2 family protein [Solirubrobacterales bacterium]